MVPERKAPPAARAPVGRAPDARDNETLYGLRASLAVFERRRQDIVAVAFESGVRGNLQALFQWAAE